VVHFCGLFPKLGIFAGFSLHIINFAGRVSESAIGGGGPILRVIELKKMGARIELARTRGQNLLVYNIELKSIFVHFYKRQTAFFHRKGCSRKDANWFSKTFNFGFADFCAKSYV
jgi:hypothetical protein